MAPPAWSWEGHDLWSARLERLGPPLEAAHDRVARFFRVLPGITVCDSKAKQTYNAAISACEKGVEWKEALQLLLEIAEDLLMADMVSFSAAISACEKSMQ